jgi:CBS-domain-containing membrane protein
MVDLAVRHPHTFHSRANVGDVRAYFASSDKVHMALLVGEDGILLSTLVRTDLRQDLPDHLPATTVGTLEGRTVSDQDSAENLGATMDAAELRRLAVIDASGRLLGLVCRKASREGFCTDSAIAARRLTRATRPR